MNTTIDKNEAATYQSLSSLDLLRIISHFYHILDHIIVTLEVTLIMKWKVFTVSRRHPDCCNRGIAVYSQECVQPLFSGDICSG